MGLDGNIVNCPGAAALAPTSPQFCHKQLMITRRFPQILSALRRLPPWLGNLTLVGLWLWLYRAAYPYLQVIFSREEFRTNQIVLLGAAALVVIQVRKNGAAGALLPRLNCLPQLSLPALGLALGGSLLYLLVERFLDINTLSAALFGLASYGLLGLWLDPLRWRQGLPAALLLVGTLPFGEHMQTFVGYPLRILTAAVVRDGLAAAGVHSVGVDTILVFENGISKVDLPCSGVKSLWTGALFFLAASWIDRRPLNLRWLLVGLVFSVLLLAANLLRVAVLVSVGVVAGWRLLAEMLHMPLGVAGFAGACLVSLFLLRWTGKWKVPAVEPVPPHPRWLLPVFGSALVLLALLYSARPQTVMAQSPVDWPLPPQLATQAWPLTSGEREWLEQAGIQSVERQHFTWRGLKGSLLLVSSTSWRAHHRPERCFEVYGLVVDESRSELVDADFPVRLLSLKAGNHPALLSAAYWLQSAEQTTDDYATRIWADLSPRRQEWVLVTVLFDSPLDAYTADAVDLYRALRDAIQQRLLGEEKP
jgi:exosortase O